MHGTRLSGLKIKEKNIADVCAVQSEGDRPGPDEPSVVPRHRCSTFRLVEIGLAADARRAWRSPAHVLTDVTYVFDDRSACTRTIERMNGPLRQLRDKGNTVLVVARIADHVVDPPQPARPVAR
jgi:hypothetical protein